MQDRKAERKTSKTIRDLGKDARKASDRAQENTSRAAEGFRNHQLKLILAAQANVNAVLKYIQDVIRAQSISELIELWTSHARR